VIIGLGHKARVGKDSIADVLVRKHGFTRLAFADALKQAALDIDPLVMAPGQVNVNLGAGRLSYVVESMGWEDAKKINEVRRFLQELGVAIRRIDPDIWVDRILGQLDKEIDYVITDVRFPNEFEALRATGALVVEVVRPGLPPLQGRAAHHPSETALEGWDWDRVLKNDGTLEDLEYIVDRFLDDLRLYGADDAG
jgi:hypothetical protein